WGTCAAPTSTSAPTAQTEKESTRTSKAGCGAASHASGRSRPASGRSTPSDAGITSSWILGSATTSRCRTSSCNAAAAQSSSRSRPLLRARDLGDGAGSGQLSPRRGVTGMGEGRGNALTAPEADVPDRLGRSPPRCRAQHLPAHGAVRDDKTRELEEAAIPHVQVDVAPDLVALELAEAHRLELEHAARVLVEVLPAAGEQAIAAFSAQRHLVDRRAGER